MALVTLAGLRWDAADADSLSRFWAEALGWRRQTRADGSVDVIPDESGCYPLHFVAGDTPKRQQNRIHFDLPTASQEEMDDVLARVRRLGAHPADVGQGQDAENVVLADPQGNELDIIPPRNGFLADTGTVGAINCDGSRALGLFWSRALDWPLVWDQGEETAIQHPSGGSKITWSGPPLLPRNGPDRIRFEVVARGEVGTTIDGLLELGATTSAQAAPGETTLIDPDGNEFHLLSRS